VRSVSSYIYIYVCVCVCVGGGVVWGGSSGGIATCYELNGPGIEFRWGTRFSAPVQPPIQLVSDHSRW